MNAPLYFWAKMVFFCIEHIGNKHIGNRKIFLKHYSLLVQTVCKGYQVISEIALTFWNLVAPPKSFAIYEISKGTSQFSEPLILSLFLVQKMLSAFYVCCIYSSAVQTRF